jgi:hypothetical protein
MALRQAHDSEDNSQLAMPPNIGQNFVCVAQMKHQIWYQDQPRQHVNERGNDLLIGRLGVVGLLALRLLQLFYSS